MSVAPTTGFNHCIWRTCLCMQSLEEKTIFVLLNCFDGSHVPVSNTFLSLPAFSSQLGDRNRAVRNIEDTCIARTYAELNKASQQYRKPVLLPRIRYIGSTILDFSPAFDLLEVHYMVTTDGTKAILQILPISIYCSLRTPSEKFLLLRIHTSFQAVCDDTANSRDIAEAVAGTTNAQHQARV